MEYLENPLVLVFKALEQSCLDEGGDGDSIFLSDKYVEYADYFEQWLKQTGNTWWERETHPDCIIFVHDQETIWFSNTVDVCPWTMTVISYGIIPNHPTR
jgi:hypothetical protein